MTEERIPQAWVGQDVILCRTGTEDWELVNSNTSVLVQYYGGVFWDVGRRQRGLVFPACLWRLGVMYGE